MNIKAILKALFAVTVWGASFVATKISFGDFLILISTVNWAVFSTLSRSGLKKHPATLMMFYVMAIGWFFTTLLFLTTNGLGEIGSLTLVGWMGVAFLSVFCSELAYIAWYDALKALTAAQTGVFLYIEHWSLSSLHSSSWENPLPWHP
jgi:drug/metabolite transporter (DMT)-like permease